MQSNNQRISELRSVIIQRMCFAESVLAYTRCKRCKLPVPLWFLCLLTGTKYSCSFGCCDSAGSIDPPDAPNQDPLKLEDWHLCCQSFLAFPKSSLWSMSTKKSTDFLLSPTPPGGRWMTAPSGREFDTSLLYLCQQKCFKFPSVSTWFWKLHLSATLSNMGFQLF